MFGSVQKREKEKRENRDKVGDTKHKMSSTQTKEKAVAQCTVATIMRCSK